MRVTRVFILSYPYTLCSLNHGFLFELRERVPISLFKLIFVPIFYTLYVKSPWVTRV